MVAREAFPGVLAGILRGRSEHCHVIEGDGKRSHASLDKLGIKYALL
jgi:hypothetical protein